MQVGWGGGVEKWGDVCSVNGGGGDVAAATFCQVMSPFYEPVIKLFRSTFSTEMSTFCIHIASPCSLFYLFAKYGLRSLFRTSLGRAACSIYTFFNRHRVSYTEYITYPDKLLNVLDIINLPSYAIILPDVTSR